MRLYQIISAVNAGMTVCYQNADAIVKVKTGQYFVECQKTGVRLMPLNFDWKGADGNGVNERDFYIAD